VPRLPVRQWSAIVRDIVRLVIGYCRRHVLHGRVRVEQVDGGVEVIFRIDEHLPVARHAEATEARTKRNRAEP
jgi:hypothetical protein